MLRLILILLITFSASGYTNTALLDVDKVITHSIAYQTFKKNWDNESDMYQKEIEAYEKKMIALDKHILERSGKISLKELNKLKNKLSEYEFTIQKLVEKRKNKLDLSFAKAINKLKEEINVIVVAYAEKYKISIVIPKSQTIYSSRDSEITDDIVNEINKKVRTLTTNY